METVITQLWNINFFCENVATYIALSTACLMQVILASFKHDDSLLSIVWKIHSLCLSCVSVWLFRNCSQVWMALEVPCSPARKSSVRSSQEWKRHCQFYAATFPLKSLYWLTEKYLVISSDFLPIFFSCWL